MGRNIQFVVSIYVQKKSNGILRPLYARDVQRSMLLKICATRDGGDAIGMAAKRSA